MLQNLQSILGIETGFPIPFVKIREKSFGLERLRKSLVSGQQISKASGLPRCLYVLHLGV